MLLPSIRHKSVTQLSMIVQPTGRTLSSLACTEKWRQLVLELCFQRVPLLYHCFSSARASCLVLSQIVFGQIAFVAFTVRGTWSSRIPDDSARILQGQVPLFSPVAVPASTWSRDCSDALSEFVFSESVCCCLRSSSFSIELITNVQTLVSAGDGDTYVRIRLAQQICCSHTSIIDDVRTNYSRSVVPCLPTSSRSLARFTEKPLGWG